ncbi:MAG: arginine--tRNA ligase, partial [Thermoguttaceae bacterium]|nr:arginine--tRNA ligase [Thermoguttaceae bacterium]
MNVLKIIAQRFGKALEAIGVEPGPYLELIRPSQDAKFGDFQANLAMPLGKKLGKAPRDVAAEIVANLDWNDWFEEPEIAGPGFINLKVKSERLAETLQKAATDDRLGVDKTANPRRVVLDYSAPNVAKPLHVGHIRSTMIGNSLARVHRFLGHDVIADNHLGDWGTQFGMIIYGFRNFLDRAAYDADPVNELARLYRLTRQLVDYRGAKKELPTAETLLDAAKKAVEAQVAKVAEAKAAADADGTKEAKDALKKANKERDRLAKLLDAAQEKLDSVVRKIAGVEGNPEIAKLAEGRENIGEAVLEETSKLHHGDEENRALWNEFMPRCIAEVDKIYERLQVQFDETLG